MTRPRTGFPTTARAFAMTAGLGLLLGACSGGGPVSGSPGGGSTLVIDTSFNLKTADPAREFEPTGHLVDKALYETLLTYKGGDVSKPVPGLASSYEQSEDGKRLTLHLRDGAKFSDGSPVTTEDVVFSLKRVSALKGNPAFLLDGVDVARKDASTVVLTSEKPNPALPSVLPNPALGIVNAKKVKAYGGSAEAGKADTAERHLNGTSEGSGPYRLAAFDTTSQVVLEKNPKYTGPQRPAYQKVVLRNVKAPTQRLNVQRGDSQIALDLNSDQVKGLRGGLKLVQGPSSNVIFLLLNRDSRVSKATSEEKFAEAVRKGLDYRSLRGLAGSGSVQAAGIIPRSIPGALPASGAAERDVTGAAAALRDSGLKKPTVTLGYASDMTIDGLSLQSLAERIQAQLKEVGITVKLEPASTATEMAKYRGGKEQMGLWYWGPDYPHANDYLSFLPGATVGKRAGWKADGDPALSRLGDKAAVTMDDAAREKQYAQIQKRLNTHGPFVPLIQPSRNTVHAPTVTGVAYNPVWTLDVAAVGAK
ncbi:ABC transporter substrate-binding protein [Streptomyces sp. ODS28]|uniref:ABC transporter substrate-binding protein n=1 Tax=Streptomyces sp. ODS28 TaxID=3136688 RepID=UPI0031E71AA0